MRPEDIFEAFSDIDEELVAGAKHIEGSDSQVIVIKPVPLWKTIAGWCAAAACLAVLVVGGILGIKYFGGKNLTPPASGTSDDVLNTESNASAMPEYPEEAKYVYTGDYSELTVTGTVCIDYVEYYNSIIRLEEKSDLIVIGEFTDDPHQTNDPKVDGIQIVYAGDSYNMFRVDRVIKGNCVEGQTILICQDGVVTNGYFVCAGDYTPMLKGDKWIYFLNKSSDREMYYPLHDTGRYPVPGSEHEFVLNDNVYGVFGGSETVAEIYEDIKERFNDWTYEEYFESEYPDNTEIYGGDYSGLDLKFMYQDSSYRVEYEKLFDENFGCDFIVSGEFIDDPRQYFRSVDDGYVGRTYNKFRVDKVYKGDIMSGQEIIIEQTGYVVDGTYYTDDNLTPMIKGDKWLYCLTKTNGICRAYCDGNGRYPIPNSGNKSLDFTDGYYGVCDTQYANKAVYERLLKELDIAVTKDFDGVVLSVMADSGSLKVTATVRNTTDKPIGLLMPYMGENSHLEISTRITRGRTTLVDMDAGGVDAALDSHIVQPGEEYVQEMNFVIPLQDSLPSPGYEVGEYKGTASISLLSDPNDTGSEHTTRLVEFSMMINERNIFTEDFDGVVLTVMTDKNIHAGEDFNVTATVRNNTNKPIGLWLPVTGEGSHTEISTRISRGIRSLTDISVAGKAFAEAISSLIIQPGEEYVQNMTFSTFTGYASDYPASYELGEYKGTATITLLSDPNDEGSETIARLVEFSVIIEGENTADNVSTEIEKVYDWHTAMDTVDWTMDEFPGVKFRFGNNTVSVLTDGVKGADGKEQYAKQNLYDGMPIYDIYLADLNYDGKREIISSVAWGSGIIDEHIEAYDFANNIHYTLENRGYTDYGLKFEGGRLIVETRKYLNSEVMTEQTLSLDMLYGVYIETPVAEISSGYPVDWVMEEFPNVTFSVSESEIAVDVNGTKQTLYGDVNVNNVFLCDLNGDGKREIVSQIGKNGILGVRAYDYANSHCYEYWADYMTHTLRLLFNGKLGVVLHSTEGEYISDFELGKLDERDAMDFPIS